MAKQAISPEMQAAWEARRGGMAPSVARYLTNQGGQNPISPAHRASFQGSYPRMYLPTEQVQDVQDFVFYDTLRFVRGRAMPHNPLKLFTNHVGSQRYVANDNSTPYKVLDFDTNMRTPNQIPKNHQLIIETIEVQVLTIGNLVPVPATGDGVSYGQDLGGPAGTSNFGVISSPVQLLHHILNTIRLETQFVTEKDDEGGPLLFFPSQYGISGSVGAAAQPPDSVNNAGLGAGTTNAIDNTFVQNGFGRPRYLSTPRILDGLDSFEANLVCDLPFVANNDFQIRVLFTGFRKRPAR